VRRVSPGSAFKHVPRGFPVPLSRTLLELVTPRHHHNERVVIHVQPIRAPDKLVIGVLNEWAINIDRQVGLVESWHWVHSRGR
jgi:hypothetical protein